MKNLQPPAYSVDELKALSEDAKLFKREKTAQEESEWARFYSDEFKCTFERLEKLFDQTGNLSDLDSTFALAVEQGALDLLRYLERPTVSEDDFKELSSVGTISIVSLLKPQNLELAKEYLLRNLNEDLLPWISTGKTPSEVDLLAAKRAIAALVAEQRTKTEKRRISSRSQEEAVRKLLTDSCGYHVDKVPDFDRPKGAPLYGVVSKRETKIAGTRADVVFGLRDGRFMAIECKVSNTEVNSFKRLNHEVVDKAQKWKAAFGTNGIVCAAVLEGSFKPADLFSAQEEGVCLFWSHDLRPLAEFVNSLPERL